MSISNDKFVRNSYAFGFVWDKSCLDVSTTFELERLPRRRLLFLTAFDPELLGARLRALLGSLPPPVLPQRPQKASKGVNATHD